MSDTYKVYLYTICQIYQNVCNLINVYIYPTIHVNTNNGIVSKRYTDLIIFVFIVLTYMLANIYSASNITGKSIVMKFTHKRLTAQIT